MHTLLTTNLVLSLLSIPITSAGQHTGSFRQARRHHARMAQPVARQAPSCQEASWQCSGSELQRCIGSQWLSIQNCTGQDIICSADPETTGCVWTWSVAQASADPSDSAPSASSTPSSASSSPSYTSPPFSPTESSPSPTETISECDPEDLEPSSSSDASSSQSVIGGNLAGVGGGGHSWYTQSSNEWPAASSSGSSAPSSADWANGAPHSSPAWSASPTSVTQGQWGQPSASASGSGSYASANVTVDWPHSSANESYPTGAPSSSTGQHGSQISSWTVSGTSTAVASNSTAAPGGGSPGNWQAPHYVIYTDYGEMNIPDVSELKDFNRFILAFWLSDRGAVDMAQVWEWMDAGARQKVLDSYHAAGIALMVSAFGSTDAPVTSGVDPTDCARRLASWVKQYNLDGVDIDWEDMHAMNTGHGEAWLITFQAELRRQLPAGQYLISHAPVAPWFTTGPAYPLGAYVKVHQEVGSGIDFYNTQFYNQGPGVYEDCHSLIFESNISQWPYTSVMEIHTHAGVSFDKIVIGKPIDAGAAANGYMDPVTLSQCVDQAESQGWNGGIMYWEWNADAPRVMATSRGH